MKVFGIEVINTVNYKNIEGVFPNWHFFKTKKSPKKFSLEIFLIKNVVLFTQLIQSHTLKVPLRGV